MTEQSIDQTPESVLEGQLVECQRAYLAWQGALGTRNRAVDAETSARGAYLRQAYAAADALSRTRTWRIGPHDADFVQAREAAWRRHLGFLTEGIRLLDDMLDPFEHPGLIEQPAEPGS